MVLKVVCDAISRLRILCASSTASPAGAVPFAFAAEIVGHLFPCFPDLAGEQVGYQQVIEV